MTATGVTWPRAALSVLVGLLVCCAFIIGQFAMRYWGAVGIFTADDWRALLPDFLGWLIDCALGLGFGIGLWAVQRSDQLGGAWRAAGVGAFAMFIAPQINAIVYMLGIGIPINWALTVSPALSRAPLPLIMGAVAGVVMWRIAYGRAARLADA